MLRKFKNIFDFLSLAEFCPLCGSRLSLTIKPLLDKHPDYYTHQIYETAELLGPYLYLYTSADDSYSTININTNVIEHYNYTHFVEVEIGQRCNKYHFAYYGTLASPDGLKVSDIYCNSDTFTQITPNVHYTVSNNYLLDKTVIFATFNDKRTDKLDLSLVEFNLYSGGRKRNRKVITDTLENIMLLK